MNTLYIASIESAGKTSLCAGIGIKLLNQGKKVGYIMPVRLSETGNTDNHEGIAFMKEALNLSDPLELISPATLSQKELWDNLTDDSQQFVKKIKETVTKVSKGKDIVIVEGLGGLIVDNVATLGCYKISEALKAKVIVILQYFESLSPSSLVRVAEEMGENLLGVIINFVPESRLETVKSYLTDTFQEAGIRLLGVLPEVRGLLGVTVKEIASAVNGEIITCRENADELVENVMVGAMTIDSGIDYFNRKSNKAAVIRGERADMQLAALETSTKSLVLTNAVRPLKQVVYQAESKHVPIVVSPDDTEQTISGIAQSLAKGTFNSLTKLKKFEQILDRNLDLDYIYSALGLKS
jgi:BioD-like phosphotransacetylase family protein